MKKIVKIQETKEDTLVNKIADLFTMVDGDVVSGRHKNKKRFNRKVIAQIDRRIQKERKKIIELKDFESSKEVKDIVAGEVKNVSKIFKMIITNKEVGKILELMVHNRMESIKHSDWEKRIDNLNLRKVEKQYIMSQGKDWTDLVSTPDSVGAIREYIKQYLINFVTAYLKSSRVLLESRVVNRLAASMTSVPNAKLVTSK